MTAASHALYSSSKTAGQCKLCVPALDVLLVKTHQASQHMFEAACLLAIGIASLLAAACALHAATQCGLTPMCFLPRVAGKGVLYMITAPSTAHALHNCAGEREP